jgi:hypothetical protein
MVPTFKRNVIVCIFRVNYLRPGGPNVLALKMGSIGFLEKQEPTLSTLLKNPKCDHYKRKVHKFFKLK